MSVEMMLFPTKALTSVLPTEVRSLADHVARLGGIALERIRFHPFPGTATEGDLLQIEHDGEICCELVDGTLVEKAVGFRESYLTVVMTHFLGMIVRQHDLGIITGEAGQMCLVPGLIRAPDIAFFSWKRLPGGRIPDQLVPNVCPDLAVEILSKGNTRAEMERKRREYFAAGTGLVWMVDPRLRTIRVYSDPDTFVELDQSQTLDGGTVLPAFALPLGDLFGELDRVGGSTESPGQSE